MKIVIYLLALLVLTSIVCADGNRLYAFENNLHDTLSGADGNNTGITFSTDVPTLGNGSSLGGHSGVFDGTAYAAIPSFNPVNYPNGITFIGWLKTSSAVSETVIGGNDGAYCAGGLSVSLNVLQLGDIGGVDCPTLAWLGTPGTTYTDGNWHHYAFVVDPVSNYRLLYADGYEVANATESAWSSWDKAFIGAMDGNGYYTDPFNFFTGSEAQTRIIDHAANASEVYEYWYSNGPAPLPPACTPSWACTGYAACNNGSQACNAVADGNACGTLYAGNYSEFTSHACGSTSSSQTSRLIATCAANPEACRAAGLVPQQTGTTFSIAPAQDSSPAWLQTIINWFKNLRWNR